MIFLNVYFLFLASDETFARPLSRQGSEGFKQGKSRDYERILEKIIREDCLLHIKLLFMYHHHPARFYYIGDSPVSAYLRFYFQFFLQFFFLI